MVAGYYALDHPNPNAVRKGYPGFWGYPTMLYTPSAVVIHTTESLTDLGSPDHGAEDVANWFQTNDTFALYHTLVDSDSTVRVVPAGLDGTTPHTAFHCAGYNSWTLGLSMATQAAAWPSLPPSWVNATLERASTEAALWAVRWDIPVVARSKAEIDAGARGFTGHGWVDPGSRTDPGPAFPWDDFLARVRSKIVSTAVPTSMEDDMISAIRTPDGSVYLVVPGRPRVSLAALFAPGTAWGTMEAALADLAKAGVLRKAPDGRLVGDVGWDANLVLARALGEPV